MSPATAAAQKERADELIELVRRRPSGMDRTEWLAARRDAARELGDLGDKRAVVVLVNIVETELFDAVAEISIEALGKLGDQRAVPALRAVVADSSRDRYVRQAARAALRKLGAAPGDGDGDGDSSRADANVGQLGAGSLIGRSQEQIAPGPSFSEDTISVLERLTFATGALRLQYDTVRQSPSLDGDLTAHYERVVDRQSLAHRFDLDGSLVGSAVDYDGDDSASRLFASTISGAAELRAFTADRPLFGLIGASGVLGVEDVKVSRPGPGNTTDETYLSADLGAVIGAGWGRVHEVGEALRLRRIEMVLRRAKALGRPITPDLASKILRSWWALRGELGTHDRLIATVTLLREAGVLLQEPDASLSYQLQQILADGQLDRRLRGLDLALMFQETYLMRDDDLGLIEGRVETIMARLRYGRQNRSADAELLADLSARYRVLVDDGEPAPWSAIGTTTWRSYRYGRYFDPVGALEFSGQFGVGKDGFDGSELATLVAGSVGWLWTSSRASGYRLAAQIGYESGEIFVGAVFEARYGLLDGVYVGPQLFGELGK